MTIHITDDLSDRWSTDMSDMKGFSCICPDIVDDDTRILRLAYLWLFQSCEESDPDAICKEEVHISTCRTRTSKYLIVFCEFYTYRLCDDRWCDLRIFGNREDIDTIFSEFRFRGRGDLRSEFTIIEWTYDFLDEGLYVLHVRYYSQI